ncbi:MAG: hypothetical protein JW818_07310 [Pirellulales bacterium]|nr:hypothetical protein [Pirellulales bacterium]
MFAGRLARSICIAAFAVTFGATGTAVATPPTAAKLVPKETCLLITVNNVGELSKRFMNTGLGRMSQDPKLHPLLKKLYGMAGAMVDAAPDNFGASLNELLSIPQGQIAFALVMPDGAEPEAVFFLDASKHLDTAKAYFAKASESFNQREETVGQTKIVIYTTKTSKKPHVVSFEREGMICFVQNVKMAKAILAAWDGQTKETLADNPHYATIVSRCTQGLSEPPQVLIYTDPIAITKAIIRSQPENTGARVALAMLPTLGLDGLKAFGVSVLLDSGPMDLVVNGHLLLDNPRTGVLDVLAFEPHDLKPGSWVPKDVADYSSIQWNFEKSLKKVGKIVDSFTREGYFSEVAFGQFRKDTGLDVEKDILPSFDGRVTIIQTVQEPIDFGSHAMLFAFRLKDPIQFAKVFDQLMADKGKGTWLKKSFGGKTYYTVEIPAKDVENIPPEYKSMIPSPCIGVIDNQLLLSYRKGIFMQVLRTVTEANGSLADEPDFKLVAGKIARLSGGHKPSAVQFVRPDETMRYLYGLLNSDLARMYVQAIADSNGGFQSIDAALKEHPLPPFSVLQRYLAPAGGFIIDDETGVHFTTFWLRRKQNGWPVGPMHPMPRQTGPQGGALGWENGWPFGPCGEEPRLTQISKKTQL